MNDVFVPIKCEREEIETVLFIQSAVPKIKAFLECLRAGDTDTLNLPFLIGIQELLKSLIFFVIEETNPLKAPLSVDNPPNPLRQKAMRECRYIDLLIDCLVFPFVEKLYKIEELSQKHPITKICQLIYRLLKHCVKDNSMNKNYVA